LSCVNLKSCLITLKYVSVVCLDILIIYCYKQAVTKKPHDSHWYARDQFFPVWRSVLTSQFITKVIPPYAPKKELPQYIRDVDDHVRGSSQKNLIDERYSQIRLGMLERSYPRVTSHRKLPSNHQPRRLFVTAASTVLKMLKHV
jgi:hypothetical protein